MQRLSFPDSLACQWHSGVCEAARGYVIRRLCAASSERVHCIVFAQDKEAIRAFADFQQAVNENDQIAPRALRYPSHSENEETAAAFENHLDRLTCWEALLEHRSDSTPLCLFTTADALDMPVPNPEELSTQSLDIKPGQQCEQHTLVESLVAAGYAHEMLCEQPGEFARRGGLVDIYPVNASAPVRVDFFGDEIDTLRTFDPASQRTTQTIESVSIAPALTPGEGTDHGYNLLDYLPQGAAGWILVEPEVLEQAHRELFWIPEKIETQSLSLKTIWEQRPADSWTGLCELDTGRSLFTQITHDWATEPLELHRDYPYAQELGLERLELEQQARIRFLDTLEQFANMGREVHFILQNAAECDRLERLLQEHHYDKLSRATVSTGDLRDGFLIQSPGEPPRALVSRTEVFGSRTRTPLTTNQRQRVQRSQVDALLDFSDLADGDTLVHLQHGVCLYRGMNRIRVGESEREVLTLEFADKVELHLPLHESHLLSRYVGLNKLRPKLGKPGSGHWEKARAAAEKATLDYAAEMLSVQARRDSEPGYAFGADVPWQNEFEGSFPYRETPDQLTAIEDIKQDMERPRPMDRLLCGDVGFGKTEVALRAAFKAVMDGRQVAVLVPTTVLAQQHFQTFCERMAAYPIVVEMLSRFRTPSQRTRILTQLKAGKIDIVVGTHALLGKQIRFARLGLVIVDEEHRFGVRHKEQLKRLRTDVDILSMSATPIPRTLYLALMGARSLSVIETAPRDRLPIETIVKNYSDELVQGAIMREVDRGGQVFYLHNRVQTIETVASRLRSMLPNLRIGVGHGQMEERLLEREMATFVAGAYDIFVCTTIIESGLDIPNCNTIIIEGADRFGLSQLYQLRGRVGRFKRQAYCYLLLHRHSALVDQARKRLSSMRQYNQLGAGFRIAMRDLELRGAGHLLGDKQSGFIAGVGFDLYCQLLRQSIARLKGDPVAARLRAQVQLDFVRLGESLTEAPPQNASDFGVLKNEESSSQSCPPIEANIPTRYIDEAQLRMELYRKLARAETSKELSELEAASTDRFGKLPKPVQALFRCTHIRVLAEEKGFERVQSDGSRLICRFADKSRGEYLKIGNRFPRLTASKALSRLNEIITFLHRQPNHTP